MSNTWPDSATFWRDKRVVVTGGAGFLGSFIVGKLRARGAAEVFVPRIEDYDPSPALDVIELLRQKGADVRYHDLYAPTIQHNGCAMAGEIDLDAALRLGSGQAPSRGGLCGGDRSCVV